MIETNSAERNHKPIHRHLQRTASCCRLLTPLILVLLICLGCTPFCREKGTSSPEISLPRAYSIATAASGPDARWWKEFASPQLDHLINQALDDNVTLEAYWARLEQARAQALMAGAELHPSLTGEISAGVGRRHDGANGRTYGTESYAAGLVAGYEIDLWGRLAALKDAAGMAFQATRDDYSTAVMSVTAEVATRWIGIISQRQLKDLLDKQLATNRTFLDLLELRFRNSQASAIDVLQQQQLVESLNSQRPLLALQERLLTQELAVLLGRWPEEENVTSGNADFPVIPLLPATGLPAELLENRPDLRAVASRLAGAELNLDAARADLMPTIRLTGRAGLESDRIRDLFDSWLANLAAALTAPILDGGRRRAEVMAAEGAAKEQLALYRQLVLTALQEVEAALIREEKLRENLASLERQLQLAESALGEARNRYLNGLTDYLPVLTQLLSVQSLEKEVVTRRGDILLARIALHRALGGAWTREPITPAPREPQPENTRHDNPT